MCLVAELCLTLCNPLYCSPTGSSVRENFPGKNTGMGCHALLQGNFPTWHQTQVSSITEKARMLEVNHTTLWEKGICKLLVSFSSGRCTFQATVPESAFN